MDDQILNQRQLEEMADLIIAECGCDDDLHRWEQVCKRLCAELYPPTIARTGKIKHLEGSLIRQTFDRERRAIHEAGLMRGEFEEIVWHLLHQVPLEGMSGDMNIPINRARRRVMSEAWCNELGCDKLAPLTLMGIVNTSEHATSEKSIQETLDRHKEERILVIAKNDELQSNLTSLETLHNASVLVLNEDLAKAKDQFLEVVKERDALKQVVIQMTVEYSEISAKYDAALDELTKLKIAEMEATPNEVVTSAPESLPPIESEPTRKRKR